MTSGSAEGAIVPTGTCSPPEVAEAFGVELTVESAVVFGATVGSGSADAPPDGAALVPPWSIDSLLHECSNKRHTTHEPLTRSSDILMRS